MENTTKIKAWTITYPLAGDVTKGNVTNGTKSVDFDVEVSTQGTGIGAGRKMAGRITFPNDVFVAYYAKAAAYRFVHARAHEVMN